MIVPTITRDTRLQDMRDVGEMTCTVAKIWDEEVGGRPEDETKDELIKGLKRKCITPIKEEDLKRRRCSSPFRPWTPCQEEPLPLVSKKNSDSNDTVDTLTAATTPEPPNGTQRRNYKNMTRERRIEANARERTRVHTISAAFETLRKSVPAYSHNQKLSKLSVLKVAASYILTLSRVLGEDYSLDSSCPSIGDCVQSVTNAIQMEGKLKKRKDE